jgi:hypothetical protein
MMWVMDTSSDARQPLFQRADRAFQFPMEFMINTGAAGRGTDRQPSELMERIAEMEVLLLSYPEIHRVTGLHTLLK